MVDCIVEKVGVWPAEGAFFQAAYGIPSGPEADVAGVLKASSMFCKVMSQLKLAGAG